ncbi:hypothetical protein FE810_06245 [Thalassotalea litorea]|uniref:Uncharacterized protein n=1 Tax=Thalassotalea litorea TaxID=2020715 RepID=A0A5R9IQH7_9GAMM|nr:hypothetical protein [Thalassotalea litorea]TLU66297.1 hypothetical protein FE810_06245 [Thalassotalea litorea]
MFGFTRQPVLIVSMSAPQKLAWYFALLFFTLNGLFASSVRAKQDPLPVKADNTIQILVFDDDLNQQGNDIFIRSINNTLEAIQLDEEFFNTGENPLSTGKVITEFKSRYQFVRLPLKSLDCQSTFEQIKNWSQIGLVLGPLTSGCTIQLLNLLAIESTNIPIINSTATRSSINQDDQGRPIYPYFFRTVHADDKRVMNVVNKLQSNQKATHKSNAFSIHIFYKRKDPYSEGLTKHLVATLEGKGIAPNNIFRCYKQQKIVCSSLAQKVPKKSQSQQKKFQQQGKEKSRPQASALNKPNAVIFATSTDDKSMAGVRDYYWQLSGGYNIKFYAFGTPSSYPFLKADSLLISMPTLNLYEGQFSNKVAQFNPRKPHYLSTVLATELTFKLMRDFNSQDKALVAEIVSKTLNGLIDPENINSALQQTMQQENWCLNNPVVCFRVYAAQRLSRETFRTQLAHEKYRFNHFGDFVSNMVDATLFEKEAQYNLKNREQVVVKPDDITASVDRRFVQLLSGSILITGTVNKPALNKNYKVRIRQQNNSDNEPEILDLAVAEDGSFAVKHTPMQMGGFDISFYRDKFRLQSQPLFFHVTLPSNPIWSLLIAFGATLLYHRDMVANRQFSRLKRPIIEALLATVLFYVFFVILKEFFGDLTPPALNSDHSLNPGLIGLICAVLGMKVLDPIINVMKNIKSDNSG